jgi:hypothetical protein
VDWLSLIYPPSRPAGRRGLGLATHLPRQHLNTTHSVSHTATGRHLPSTVHRELAGAANRPGGSPQQTPSETPKAQALFPLKTTLSAVPLLQTQRNSHQRIKYCELGHRIAAMQSALELWKARATANRCWLGWRFRHALRK